MTASALPTRLRTLAARRQHAMRNMSPSLDRDQLAQDVADLKAAACQLEDECVPRWWLIGLTLAVALLAGGMAFQMARV